MSLYQWYDDKLLILVYSKLGFQIAVFAECYLLKTYVIFDMWQVSKNKKNLFYSITIYWTKPFNWLMFVIEYATCDMTWQATKIESWI